MNRAFTPHVLTIVIPALNEEESIGPTISRCLAAADGICSEAGLSDVEVIVVSDGSTDKTVEIARSFEDVEVIEFPKNRGYGAAITAGFEKGRGDLVSFLDADGTCDPVYFGALCKAVLEDGADVALGSRMGPDSQMPPIRRLGNRIYALLLGFLTGRSVTDTASGMRVLKRSSYEQLAPLPDGLHFTPSMSARALVAGMRVSETPMKYEERIGESKLSVLRDGVRFLFAIFSGILCYRPDRLFLLAFVGCLLSVIVLGAAPTEYYFEHGELQESMIYRFFACLVLSSSGCFLLSATAISFELGKLGPQRKTPDSFTAMIISKMFTGIPLAVLMSLLAAGSLFVLWPGIVEYVTTRTCTLHWSRLVVGGFFLLAGVLSSITALLVRVVGVWAARPALRKAQKQIETP